MIESIAFHLYTLVMLWIVRIAQWIFPYATWRRMGERLRHVEHPQPADAAFLGRVNWTIKRMSKLVPRVNCLTQAVTVAHLLARRKIVSRMNIGVKPASNGRIDAHAWVTVDVDGVETLVIGGRVNLRRYTRLGAVE